MKSCRIPLTTLLFLDTSEQFDLRRKLAKAGVPCGVCGLFRLLSLFLARGTSIIKMWLQPIRTDQSDIDQYIYISMYKPQP
jgi:hypothetical protein